MTEHVACDSPRPVLMRGACLHWRAVAQWTLDWFALHLASAPVVVWRSSGAPGELGRKDTVSMGAFVAELRRETGDDVYAGNGALAAVDPRLVEDVERPWPHLPGDGGNLWIGRAGHVSHLHYDAHVGLLCGVRGRKVCRLWAPGRVQQAVKGPLNVYQGSVAVSPDGAVQGLPEPDATLVLDPGDVLLIPFYWWHLVSSETDTISVNFWFYPLRAAQLAKFEDEACWRVTRGELLRMLAQCNSKLHYTLVREDVLRALYVKFHRCGTKVPDELFERHKDRLVDVVQEFLRDQRQRSAH